MVVGNPLTGIIADKSYWVVHRKSYSRGNAVTFTEAASAMRRVADAFDKVVIQKGDCDTGHPKPMLTEDQSVGAAMMLCYLRDLVQSAPREDYNRVDLLVLLETMSRDEELFPCGCGKVMWDMESEDGK